MASVRGGMKDFYKQKKKSGISKPNNKASKPSSRKTKSPANSATLGSGGVQPAALISHGFLDLQGLSLSSFLVSPIPHVPGKLFSSLCFLKLQLLLWSLCLAIVICEGLSMLHSTSFWISIAIKLFNS